MILLQLFCAVGMTARYQGLEQEHEHELSTSVFALNLRRKQIQEPLDPGGRAVAAAPPKYCARGELFLSR